MTRDQNFVCIIRQYRTVLLNFNKADGYIGVYSNDAEHLTRIRLSHHNNEL